jgi:hypothetical protein
LPTGESFVAVLTQSADSEDFVRLDYSAAAWTEGARPDKSVIILGFWRGVVPDPGAKKRLLIDDQSLLELFEQSGEEAEGSAERAAFRFVLSLILLRKRLLVQEGSKGKTMLVRARGTPRPPEGPAYMEVADPGLDEGAIARVTEQLGAVLSDGGVSEGAEQKGGEA